MNFTLCIILNRDGITLLFISWNSRNQIEHKFIINLKIRDAYCVFIIKAASNFLENLRNSSRNETSVFIVLHATAHGESFSSSCLTIYHHSSVKSVNYRAHYVSWACIKHVFLAGVMKDLVKFKTPAFLLVVDNTTWFILWNVHINMLYYT